ncbi:hypothetical protein NQ317_004249 [Molorchus minor]|uniref:DUF5641 domain-containing protein n=1 Tax=Molorchus minor TaxID=1323400 RepID=A0ABQ9JZ28_9CUCU|nr:hypothetical protein NQ317_004249 [Molorchus minor]
MSRLDRWQKVQALHQNFWRRWSKEYLNTLQQRNGWNDTSNPIAVGKLVLIRNELTPPLQWKMGRVTEVYPGTDNIIRVAKEWALTPRELAFKKLAIMLAAMDHWFGSFFVNIYDGSPHARR